MPLRRGNAYRTRANRMAIHCTSCGQESSHADGCTICASPLTVHHTAWRTPLQPNETVSLTDTAR